MKVTLLNALAKPDVIGATHHLTCVGMTTV
jgi:hypothetical protein